MISSPDFDVFLFEDNLERALNVGFSFSLSEDKGNGADADDVAQADDASPTSLLVDGVGHAAAIASSEDRSGESVEAVGDDHDAPEATTTGVSQSGDASVNVISAPQSGMGSVAPSSQTEGCLLYTSDAADE